MAETYAKPTIIIASNQGSAASYDGNDNEAGGCTCQTEVTQQTDAKTPSEPTHPKVSR